MRFYLEAPGPLPMGRHLGLFEFFVSRWLTAAVYVHFVPQGPSPGCRVWYNYAAGQSILPIEASHSCIELVSFGAIEKKKKKPTIIYTYSLPCLKFHA